MNEMNEMNNKKYASLSSLQLFLDNLRTVFACAKEEITDIEHPLVLNDNTEYRLTNVSNLTLVYPKKNFEVWMNVSFSPTGTISVAFPSETQYIGVTPTFNNGETWEISIKDGTAVCWRVE